MNASSAGFVSLVEGVSVGAVLVLLILACVIGNLLVILAICLERELRARPQFYLIFSLAVADLIVGVIVTPLGAWTTVSGAWPLGVTICDLWISVDVVVCTASILHLVAIALDRYWSVTDICYVQNRTPRRVVSMLAVIWTVSLLISLAPFAGWKDEQFRERVEQQRVCLISQQISYQVFSTATAFYIPLCAIICVYWKIMRAAKKRFRRERDRRTVHTRSAPAEDAKKVPLITKKALKGAAPPPPPVVVESGENGNGKAVKENSSGSDEEKATGDSETRIGSQVVPGKVEPVPANGIVVLHKKRKRPKETPETKRERKAWRTLAIITGTFVACWTPFFLVSLYRPICRCSIPPLLEAVTNWLGYLNSALNPIIYTIFSQDFRNAFKKILKRICFIHESI